MLDGASLTAEVVVTVPEVGTSTLGVTAGAFFVSETNPLPMARESGRHCATSVANINAGSVNTSAARLLPVAISSELCTGLTTLSTAFPAALNP